MLFTSHNTIAYISICNTVLRDHCLMESCSLDAAAMNTRQNSTPLISSECRTHLSSIQSILEIENKNLNVICCLVFRWHLNKKVHEIWHMLITWILGYSYELITRNVLLPDFLLVQYPNDLTYQLTKMSEMSNYRSGYRMGSSSERRSKSDET